MPKHIFVSRLQVLLSLASLVVGGCMADADTEADRKSSSVSSSPGAAAGSEGARCGFGVGAPRCGAGLFCSPTSDKDGVCRGISRMGERCGAGRKPLCANGLVCSAKAGGDGICRSRVGFGQACEGTNPPCAEGLSCDMTTSAYTCQRGG